MNVILKPMVPRIQKIIEEHGADGIVRIDLDEDEFERLYNECKEGGPYSYIDIEKVKPFQPRKGSHLKIRGVAVQCCY